MKELATQTSEKNELLEQVRDLKEALNVVGVVSGLEEGQGQI